VNFVFRPNRTRRAPDRTLLHRMALFGVAAVLALAGILWSRNILINTAILILAAAILLGLWGRKSREDGDDGPSDD